VVVFYCLWLLLLIDRWLKWLALNGTTHSLPWLYFILFKNNALVFSWPAPNWVAIVLMIIAVLVVLVLMQRMWRRRNVVAFYGSVLMLIGALSNLYDRLAYGFVIDWGFVGRWWPVFNLADIMIAVGLALILFSFSPRTGRFKPAGTL